MTTFEEFLEAQEATLQVFREYRSQQYRKVKHWFHNKIAVVKHAFK